MRDCDRESNQPRGSANRLMTSQKCSGMFVLVVMTTMLSACQASTYNGHGHSDDKPKVIGVTCWTCNKSTNAECNRGAPNLPCPIESSVCKTVHRFSYATDVSLRVTKMCSASTACSTHHIGCRNVSYLSTITECTSCCDYQFCNEQVPFNIATSLSFSSVLAADSARSLQTTLCDVIFVACLSVAAVASITATRHTVTSSIDTNTTETRPRWETQRGVDWCVVDGCRKQRLIYSIRIANQT